MNIDIKNIIIEYLNYYPEEKENLIERINQKQKKSYMK